MDVWSGIRKVSDLKKGLLLEGYWDLDGFNLIFYDPKKRILVKWKDKRFVPTVRFRGWVDEFEVKHSKQLNLLNDRVELVADIPIIKTGTRQTQVKIKNQGIARKLADELRYYHQSQITPGVWYSITDKHITCLNSQLSDELSDDIDDKLLGETTELVDLARINIPLLNAELCDIRRVAFDIELSSPRGKFPTVEQAEYVVNSIGIYDSDDLAIVLLHGIHASKSEILEAAMRLGYQPEVRTFIEERDLHLALYEIISDYPLILSYNGDNFDLPYLMYRGKKLGIETPISMGHFRGRQPEYHIKNTIHLDLYRFFKNNAVRLYAYGGKYQRTRLDDVAEALLGTKKVAHDLWFDEMSKTELIEYNITDVKLTMDLTRYSSNLTLSLMLILMRVGKFTISYVNRESISKWILNWIAFEHERKGILLPPKKDILKHKGGFLSASEGGKQYQGAIVLEVERAGVYWDVIVADFASLYPSVIKKYNLSYETMRCNHGGCKVNRVPGVNHWVCTKRTGIMAALVGFVRDARVRWYKPLSEKSILAKTIQAALKVFINASYGVFGAESFELFCPPVAESTTAYSRSALLEAKRQAEEMGFAVIYGDTDSLFIKDMDHEQFMLLKIWSVVELGIELGIDYKFRFLVMSGRKKNYFGVTTEGKIIAKGLQVIKRNTAIFIRKLFDQVTNELIEVQNPMELEEAKITMIDIIRTGIKDLRNGRIEIQDLSKIATLNKPLHEYTSPTAAIQAAIQKYSIDNENEIEQGSQFQVVSVIKQESIVKISKFPQFHQGSTIKCSVRDISQVHDYHLVDIDKYIELIKKAFIPIFDAFELDWDIVLYNNTTLDQFFN